MLGNLSSQSTRGPFQARSHDDWDRLAAPPTTHPNRGWPSRRTDSSRDSDDPSLAPTPRYRAHGRWVAVGDGQQLLGTAVVSIVVLIAALFVILSGNYADADKKWPYGAVGTIVGYWLNAH